MGSAEDEARPNTEPSNLGVCGHALQGRFQHPANWVTQATSRTPPAHSELETRAPSPESGSRVRALSEGM